MGVVFNQLQRNHEEQKEMQMMRADSSDVGCFFVVGIFVKYIN